MVPAAPALGDSDLAILRVGHLSPWVLLVVDRPPAGGNGVSFHARQGESWIALESSSTDRVAAARSEPGEARLSMVVLPAAGTLEGFALEAGDSERLELAGGDLRRITEDVKTIARHHIAPLPAAERNAMLEFMAMGAKSRLTAGGARANRALFGLRQGLRERLPKLENAPSQARGATVDSILGVDERSFYIEGWARDTEAEISRLTIVSPEGCRAELRDRAYFFKRPDVMQFFDADDDGNDQSGFVAFFELAAPSMLPNGWLLEIENSEGTQVEVEGPPVVRQQATIRESLLNDPVRDRMPDDELMAKHIVPAMTRLQDRMAAHVGVDSVTDVGPLPAAPEVTIVIPLYRRIDHVESQLAEFADDPEMQETEVIYVLDSPEQGDQLLDMVPELFEIYRVPLRVAVLEQNVGFAGANNAGAGLARGRLLLLLNSDVLPSAPGWLKTMRDFYDSTPSIGALGPKLIYEDNSIQHAGMYFFQPPGRSVWLDSHYYKGLHTSFPAANVARIVPAVSGACMMVAREHYERLGGLRGMFVRGDYEDFDLCLRLRKEGLDSWYLPDAQLYHLEAQSYTADLRTPANRYNMWLHTHIWGDEIASLMARDFSPD